MLTLALSMVLYGALVKSTALGGSDGFNVGRPSLFGMVFTDPREADFMLYAVSVVTTGLAGIAATILFRSELGLASLAVRENNLRVEYLGISANRVITINFVIAAIFAGASGAFALMAQRHIDPQFAYWTTSGEFVFVAVLAGIPERRRGVRRLDGAGAGSFVLEPLSAQHLAARARRLPAGRHPVSAARHRLALDQGQAAEAARRGGNAVPPKRRWRGEPGPFRARSSKSALARWSPPTP